MEGEASTLGDMVVNPKFWKDKVVFLTGHTGFKGGWMAMWLTNMGAKVVGYSLAPPTSLNFFEVNQLESILYESNIGDVRDLATLTTIMKAAQPSVVIHMAAQSLVRESYKTPVDTFDTNIMGTVNLLEATRNTDSVKAVLVITTDKCYENKEWFWPYRENDRLGGRDPYSNSKACAELVTAAYGTSFFESSGKHLATARAGNVIGGGDWADNRLIPDFFRALEAGEKLRIRLPNAVRPWQHVLEPICGYLQLLENMYDQGIDFNGAWNFGPEEVDAKPVSYVADYLCEKNGLTQWEKEYHPHPHEAGILKLDISKAKNHLNWRPRWSLESALDATYNWHMAWKSGVDMPSFTFRQIQNYIKGE